MKQMKRWRIRYDINGGEYVGYMVITASRVDYADTDDKRIIVADGIQIKMDEDVLSIHQIYDKSEQYP